MLLAPEGLDRMQADSSLLSKYGALLDIALRVGDIVFIIAAALLAEWARFRTFGLPQLYLGGVIRAVLLGIIVFPAARIYRSWRVEGLLAEISRVALAWTAVMALFMAVNWLLKRGDDYSRLWIAGWYLCGLALLVGGRACVRLALGAIRARGLDAKRVVLVGATDVGAKVLSAARNNPWMGLNVVGFVSTPYDQHDMTGVPCVGDLDVFMDSLKHQPPDQIWIALPMKAEAAIRHLLAATNDVATTVRLVPDLFGYSLINHHATTVGDTPVITLRRSRIDGYNQIIKGIEDRLLAALILVLISPLMMCLAIGVKLSSPGPVIFAQKRHGLGGKTIEVWKFRSMRQHRETGGTVTQAKKNDSRVTPFGRFLRATSLDELPQFINVLQGRMSIVGPRPHAIEHNDYYKYMVMNYMSRHHVKPGITGWAQINGLRGETDTLDKMKARIELDLFYVRNWSLWFDLKVILLTPISMIIKRDAY